MTTPARPILVTGAGGFVGRHLVERLAKDGGEVRGLVRAGDAAGTGAPRATGWSPYAGDLADPPSLQAAARDTGLIYHLASRNDPGFGDPAGVFRANAVGTVNVLEAARTAGARVVLVSTSHVLGRPARLPAAEDLPPDPRSPYAASKVAAEALGRCYGTCYGLEVSIVRPFNIYGPGQIADAVVPTILRQALAGGPIRVRALGPRRDFVFVADLVDALVLCGRDPAAVGRTFNLGSGTGRSVGEIVAETLDLLHLQRPVIESDPGAAADSIVCDPTSARLVLRWQARTPFRDGLRQTIDWWRGKIAR